MNFDTLYYNANIITVDDSKPRAKWIAVKNGKIAALGDQEPPTVSAAKIFDLKGKTMLPGFIDSHAHGVTTGFCINSIRLGNAASLDDVLGSVKNAAVEKPDNSWLFGAELNALALKEGRLPTCHELDKVSGEHPVMIVAMTFHAIALNTKAMELVRVPEDMPGVEKDKAGKALGIYTSDESSFLGMSRALGMVGDDEIEKWIRDCVDSAVKQGVTTLHSLDGRLVDQDRDFFIWLNIKDTLPIHSVNYFQSTNVNLARALKLPRIGGCLTLDGTGFETTMAISEPYDNAADTNGVLYWNDEEVYQFVASAHKAGLQCGMHAMGDRAIEQLLNTHLRVIKEQGNPKKLRHRIEHFALCTPEQIKTAIELDMILVMQPAFAYLWDNPDMPMGASYIFNLGKERAANCEPIGDIVRAGGTVAGSSDSAVSPINPLLGIHAAVNARNPRRRLDVDNAIKLFTINGAIAAREENERGSIEPGKYADLVILDRDPYEEKESIEGFLIEQTIAEGKVVYDRAF